MPINEAIVIYQGEDIALNFTMTPVVNITGWTLELNIATSRANTVKIITQAGAIVSGPAGTYTVTLTDIQTDTLIPSVYAYDVWRTNAGNERILTTGDFTVKDPVR